MIAQRAMQFADQLGAAVVAGAGMAIVAVSMTAQYITLAVGVLNGIALIAGGVLWLVHLGSKSGQSKAAQQTLSESVDKLTEQIAQDRQERRERDRTIFQRLDKLGQRVASTEAQLKRHQPDTRSET